MQEMQVWSLGGKDPLEEEMATHSSVLAWKIPRIEPCILSPWVSRSWTLSNRAHKMLWGVYRSLPGTGLKAVCPVTLAGHTDFVKLGLIAWKLLYLASHKQNTNCCCSVAQSCLALCSLMNCSTPDSSAVHCLRGYSCPLSQWHYWTTPSFASCFSPWAQSFSASCLFQWVGS